MWGNATWVWGIPPDETGTAEVAAPPRWGNPARLAITMSFNIYASEKKKKKARLKGFRKEQAGRKMSLAEGQSLSNAALPRCQELGAPCPAKEVPRVSVRH